MRNAIFVVFCLVLAINLYADIPDEINYQGKITDTLGVARNGYYTLTFKIYDDPAVGAPLWTETHDSVMVFKGLFDVILGSINPIDLPFDEPYWLEIEVEGETLEPRVKLTSVPYAFRSKATGYADSAGKAAWGDIAGIPAGFADGVDNVGGDDAVIVSLTAADTIDIGDAVFWGDNNSLPGFNYFMPIYIDNSATSPLYDYQVKVDIGPSSTGFWAHANADGSDIRFLDGDRITFLHYWIDAWSYPASATIWVKVPYIPAQKIKVIYLYYGESSASSLSDGISTFDFYEQFELLDTVRHWEPAGTWSTNGGWSWEMDTLWGSPAPCFRIYSTGDPASGAKYFWCRVDKLSMSNQYAIHYWMWGQCSGLEPSATFRYYNEAKQSGVTIMALEECWSSTNYYISETDYVFTPPSPTIFLYFRLWDSQFGWNMSARLDDVRIRKYISPEPTVTVSYERNSTITGVWRACSGDGNRCMGVATSAANPGATVNVCVYGTAAGLSGFTTNRLYYISDTPGMMETTPAAFVAPVGVATSATELKIKR